MYLLHTAGGHRKAQKHRKIPFPLWVTFLTYSSPQVNV
jgi:hypothetical protein